MDWLWDYATKVVLAAHLHNCSECIRACRLGRGPPLAAAERWVIEELVLRLKNKRQTVWVSSVGDIVGVENGLTLVLIETRATTTSLTSCLNKQTIHTERINMLIDTAATHKTGVCQSSKLRRWMYSGRVNMIGHHMWFTAELLTYDLGLWQRGWHSQSSQCRWLSPMMWHHNIQLCQVSLLDASAVNHVW